MISFFYTVCNAFCALPMWQQTLVGTVCVFITAGIIYLALWGFKTLLYRLAESVGIMLDDDRETYEADWMDFDAWEGTAWHHRSRT